MNNKTKGLIRHMCDWMSPVTPDSLKREIEAVLQPERVRYTLDDFRGHHPGWLQGEDADHYLYPARYVNGNYFASAIVASVRFFEGNLVDWAAYWHGCDLTEREEDAVRWVQAKGMKMLDMDAQHYFPRLPFAYFRY